MGVRSQISTLLADLPTIRQNVSKHLTSLSNWTAVHTSVWAARQTQFIKEHSNKLLTYTGQVLSGVVDSLASAVVFFALIRLYIFLLMRYKDMLMRFVQMRFRPQTHDWVREAVIQIQSIVKDYIIGLLIQITYMIVLAGVGQLFGIQHALLVGLIFVLLNLIPYLGAFTSILITLAFSLDLGPILTVLIVITVG